MRLGAAGFPKSTPASMDRYLHSCAKIHGLVVGRFPPSVGLQHQPELLRDILFVFDARI
ncbi:hypothetical protein PthBH41_14890 [Parageobacillus thermoglucosidasius]|nr:Muramoyltetrapeptide carboxypeptidase [Anoxybacillus flavithermus]OAO87466.1 Muramoyltetrapeptide carboxypeptidase [Parageobacillus thermoglucosidasius]BDG31777.1 hypothetical protein PthBH41_14890 [Parageobacillus thermoglucosidasius]GAJ42924.1 hypothetical protein GT2_05_01520 [Parageobacillus thermoglucosidasius NBRC 107763]